MDRNTIIGVLLIMGLLIVWQWYMAPSQEEIARQKQQRDSIALVNKKAVDKAPSGDTTTANTASPSASGVDTAGITAQNQAIYGPFAAAATGAEQLTAIENDLFAITFTNKGGRIKEVVLKKYKKQVEDAEGKINDVELKLLEDKKNKFEYFLPLRQSAKGGVNTADLYFRPMKTPNGIAFRADAGDGKYIEQTYSISPQTYKIDYAVRMVGLQDVLAPNTGEITLNWVNYLDRIEINTNYERNYSTVYYKIAEDDPTYCSCTADDTEELNEAPVKWVSHANQFFNSSLIAQSRNFKSAKLETKLLDEKGEDLKKLSSVIQLPFGNSADEQFNMALYVGPNEFDRLYAMGEDLQDIVPFGSSIFGTINRWVIRPIFNFLSGFIGSKGIVILFLTLLVKLLVYPLTYRMLYSQSKMGALKPQLAALKEKYKDDTQQQQMETMKMYREFGVNPLGGCFPMLLQMPIWFALYRFFPASIEFRQASFLWAHDLSSYDVIARLPFEIPMGFGAHISLFTLLWAVSTLAYTYYNSQHMDFSANPAMKYLQYIMPILFLGFFNSFASGLTCYLLFSNLLNIGQTIITKNFIIDEDKIRKQLEENKKKPKKKSGFQERLESAMKEQQRIQAAKEQDKKKGNKK